MNGGPSRSRTTADENAEAESYTALQNSVTVLKKHLGTLIRPTSAPLQSTPNTNQAIAIVSTIPKDLLLSLKQVTTKAESFGQLLRIPLPGSANAKKRKSRPGDVEDDLEAIARQRDLENLKKRSAAREKRKDWIDSQGVQLWNQCSSLKQMASGLSTRANGGNSTAIKEWDNLIAAVKLSAYRLIEAVTDVKPSGPYLIRILNLAAKTSTSLYANTQVQEAGQILEKAADYQQILAKTPVSVADRPVGRETVLAHVGFYLARVEIEIGKDNGDFALTLMKQALKQDELGLLTARDYLPMTSQCWKIGVSLLTAPKSIKQPQPSDAEKSRMKAERAEAATLWLKTGLEAVEKGYLIQGDQEEEGSLKTLKLSIQLALAQAYSAATNLEGASASSSVLINELLRDPEVNTSDMAQTLRSIKLENLRKGNSSSAQIASVVRDIIANLTYDSDTVLCLLSEINLLSHNHSDIVMPLLQSLLEASLGDQMDERRTYTNKILLNIIVQAQNKVTRSSREAVAAALKACGDCQDFRMTSDESMACSTLIWRIAETRCDISKDLEEAGSWFLVGAHPGLHGDPLNAMRCQRRAIICFIQNDDLAQAQQLLLDCPQEAPETKYLMMLLAIQSNKYEEAAIAVKEMSRSPDVNGEMLLAATQAACDLSDPHMLRTSLESLSYALKHNMNLQVEVDELVLIRSLIRVTVTQLDMANQATTASASSTSLVQDLLKHFRTALEVANKLKNSPAVLKYSKEVAWLYKTAYNLGHRGSGSWSDVEMIAAFFDVSIEFMLIYKDLATADLDPDLGWQMTLAGYASLTTTMMRCRKLEPKDKPRVLQSCLKRLQRCKAALSEARLSEDNIKYAAKMKHVLAVFEVEARCFLADWDGVTLALTDMAKAGMTLVTCEAVADLLIALRAPIKVQHMSLELALDVATREPKTPAVSFARWLRPTMDLLFHGGEQSDKDRILEYVKKAIKVMEQAGEQYPQDEIDWLMKQLWNQGLYAEGLSDKAWAAKMLELSLSFCKYHKEGDLMRKEMHTAYTRLVSK